MENNLPATGSQSEYVTNIAWDIIWTVLTCGLYNIYVQYRQIHAVNAMLKQDKYHFGWWALFTLVTFGLYHIYHEYRISEDIAKLVNEPQSSLPIISIICTVLGVWIVADAIQQTYINRFYGVHSL